MAPVRSVCSACGDDAADGECVCAGFCGKSFHYKCTGLTPTITKELKRPGSQLLWSCKSCRDIQMGGFSALLGQLESRFNTLKSELIEAFRNEVFKKPEGQPTITTPFGTAVGPIRAAPLYSQVMTNRIEPFQYGTPGNAPKRRLTDRSPPAPTQLLMGTASTSPSLPFRTVPEQPRCWLFLTRIAPEVTREKVATMVQKSMETDDLVIHPLIPRGLDPGTLNFISYKVGLPMSLRDKAMEPSSWPLGLVFREFIDRRQNVPHFRRPSAEPPLHQPAAPLSPNYTHQQQSQPDTSHQTQVEPSPRNTSDLPPSSGQPGQ